VREVSSVVNYHVTEAGAGRPRDSRRGAGATVGSVAAVGSGATVGCVATFGAVYFFGFFHLALFLWRISGAAFFDGVAGIGDG
jgi:hypothetical protein